MVPPWVIVGNDAVQIRNRQAAEMWRSTAAVAIKYLAMVMNA